MPSAGRALATPCRSGGSREPFLLIGWIKSSRLPPLLHGPGGHGFRLEGSCFRAPNAAAPAPPALPAGHGRPAPASSEERRGGKEWVMTVRSRWSPYHNKTNNNATTIKTTDCKNNSII